MKKVANSVHGAGVRRNPAKRHRMFRKVCAPAPALNLKRMEKIVESVHGADVRRNPATRHRMLRKVCAPAPTLNINA